MDMIESSVCGGSPRVASQWIGGFQAYFYDKVMEKVIFPKKFGGDLEQHYTILNRYTSAFHGLDVLELAAGSGDCVRFLPTDNTYTGVDISMGLLKQAKRKINKAGYRHARLLHCAAEDLPLPGNQYDLVLCNLALNFFTDSDSVLNECCRVLKTGSSQEFVHSGDVVAGLDATFRLRLLLCFPECTMILKPPRALLLSRCDLPPDTTFSLSSGHNVMPDDDPSSEIACVKSDRCLKLRRRTRKRHHVKT